MTPPAASQTAATPVISVRDVGKRYRIYEQPQDRLKQMLLSRLGRQYGRDFWALRHVNFEVAPGERFGVIGRNGSGKSTLLEMIAGTLPPTEGTLQVRGRVAALLELGSGFNPEFSGRENVFLNAAIHGLTREQVETRFDDIAAFADIGTFIDQPVKLYSSGMFVRLAFAVGTSIDADLLLIDEALAVGDVFFRQKCYRRLDVLRERGVSVVLVSHGMGDIEEFCDRALLLDRGEAVFVGPSVEAVKRYYLVESRERARHTIDASLPPETRPDAHEEMAWPRGVPRHPPSAVAVSDGMARLVALALCDERDRECQLFEQGQRAHFWFEFEVDITTQVPIAGLVLHNEKGVVVHGKSTLEHDAPVPWGLVAGQRFRVRQEVTLDVGIGEYTFLVGLSMIAREIYLRRHQISHLELATSIVRLCEVPAAGQFVVSFRKPAERIQLLHHGVANLPGTAETSVVARTSVESPIASATSGRDA